MNAHPTETASLVGAVAFTRLTPADRELYERYAARQPLEISDLSFVSRMAWAEGFHYHKAVIEDALVIVAQVDVFTGLHFSAPLGLKSCSQLGRIVDRIWAPYAAMSEVLTEQDPRLPAKPHLRFLFVSEDQLDCYRQVPGYQAEIRYLRDYSDYLYDAEKLRTLSGKALHAKRNHLNRFFKEHPQAVYAPIQASDREEALALTAGWCARRAFDPVDIRSSDYPAIQAVFEQFDHLDIRGGTLREEGVLRAFSIYGHRGEDLAFCHFEKAARGHEDFYVAINALTLREAFPTAKWVNREEDMGIEGLRKAKLSYKPARLVNKYEVILTRA